MSTAPDATLHELFLAGMRRVAHTVSVVTTDGPAGRAGATVSAMTSVSVDTPLPTLLVCLNAASHTGAAAIGNGIFTVNVLAATGIALSDRFAGRGNIPHEARFEGIGWRRGASGAPVLADALVAFECRVLSSSQVGTHHVIIGEVSQVTLAQSTDALVYLNRTYGRFQPL